MINIVWQEMFIPWRGLHLSGLKRGGETPKFHQKHRLGEKNPLKNFSNLFFWSFHTMRIISDVSIIWHHYRDQNASDTERPGALTAAQPLWRDDMDYTLRTDLGPFSFFFFFTTATRTRQRPHVSHRCQIKPKYPPRWLRSTLLYRSHPSISLREQRGWVGFGGGWAGWPPHHHHHHPLDSGLSLPVGLLVDPPGSPLPRLGGIKTMAPLYPVGFSSQAPWPVVDFHFLCH